MMDGIQLRLQDATPSLEKPFATDAGDEGGKAAGTGKGFGEIVGDLIAETNQSQNEAEAKATGLAEGKATMMETVLALNEADLSLRMLMEVRNRALEAYQQIMRSL